MTQIPDLNPNINSRNNSDQIFAEKLKEISPFAFDQKVSSVFDDMVTRSIPNYQQVNTVIFDLVRTLCKQRKNESVTIIDLGCSTAETLKQLDNLAREEKLDLKLYGLDSSPSMIVKAKEKMKSSYCEHTLDCQDIFELEKEKYPKADLIIMNYTLQFIPLESRARLMRLIYNHLKAQSFLLLSEKIISDHSMVETLQTEFYYNFKRRNGYSELEISQKRKALEDVLIPVTDKDQRKLIKDAGFDQWDSLFRFYNFTTYICYKNVHQKIQGS